VTTHEEFLDLASAAIDFELDPDERAALDRHLAGCDSCRQTVEAFRDDAATIGFGPAPRLAPGQSVAILAAALRPPKGGPSVRLLAVAALVALMGGGLLAVGFGFIRPSEDPLVAVLAPSPGKSSAEASSISASPHPTASAGATLQPPPATPRPGGSPIVGSVQVRGDAGELGTLIRMAPGAAGDFYVSIPATDGTVLARLDADGDSTPGWPIFIPGSESCDQLLPVTDGSVRLICHRPAAEEGLGGMITRVHAFGANGRPLPAWPVEIEDVVTGRMVGSELTLLIKPYVGDVSETDTPETVLLATVAADGSVQSGPDVQFDCCEHSWAIGPDGIGYGTTHRDWDTSVKTDIEAFGLDGLRIGWPKTIDGNASDLAFDAEGRVYAIVGSPNAQPARTIVIDHDGRDLPTGSSDQAIVSTNPWTGAGADYPGSPIVAGDGTSYIVQSVDGQTRVQALDPGGQRVVGWPYESDLGLQEVGGGCPAGDTGCGSFLAAPVVAPGNVLFLIEEAANSADGSRLVALAQDGRVVDGWPVQLRRAGSEFWSIVAGPDGRVYALAIEPEPNGAHSATILAIAPDSDVQFNVTVVEP
jgi:anti-sigma factor RsiW